MDDWATTKQYYRDAELSFLTIFSTIFIMLYIYVSSTVLSRANIQTSNTFDCGKKFKLNRNSPTPTLAFEYLYVIYFVFDRYRTL